MKQFSLFAFVLGMLVLAGCDKGGGSKAVSPPAANLPKIDGSSEEAFKASQVEVAASLKPEYRKGFLGVSVVVTEQVTKELGAAGITDEERVRERLDGKTGEEAIYYGESILQAFEAEQAARDRDPNPPRIDGTSEEKFQASCEAMKRGRTNIDQLLITSSLLKIALNQQKQDEAAGITDEEKTKQNVRTKLHGRTEIQLLEMAEEIKLK